MDVAKPQHFTNGDVSRYELRDVDGSAGVRVRGANHRTALDAYTPLTLSRGAPAGSYPLSGFDAINLYNGNLNFSLPLLKVGGRGEAEFSRTLPSNCIGMSCISALQRPTL